MKLETFYYICFKIADKLQQCPDNNNNYSMSTRDALDIPSKVLTPNVLDLNHNLAIIDECTPPQYQLSTRQFLFARTSSTSWSSDASRFFVLFLVFVFSALLENEYIRKYLETVRLNFCVSFFKLRRDFFWIDRLQEAFCTINRFKQQNLIIAIFKNKQEDREDDLLPVSWHCCVVISS